VWLEEVPASLPVDYFFSAKELDSETGFYAFVARYLDPRFSKWMSADPALAKYLPEAGKGIAYQSPSLANNWRSYTDLPHLDPRFNKWMSADAALVKPQPETGKGVAYQFPSLANHWRSYPDLPGMGGVFEPTNIALFSYGHNNPATLTDPAGLDV